VCWLIDFTLPSLLSFPEICPVANTLLSYFTTIQLSIVESFPSSPSQFSKPKSNQNHHHVDQNQPSSHAYRPFGVGQAKCFAQSLGRANAGYGFRVLCDPDYDDHCYDGDSQKDEQPSFIE